MFLWAGERKGIGLSFNDNSRSQVEGGGGGGVWVGGGWGVLGGLEEQGGVVGGGGGGGGFGNWGGLKERRGKIFALGTKQKKRGGSHSEEEKR